MDYDKSMEYISQTQTLIGKKKRELLDTETGEIIHVDQITKRNNGAKNFWKCYLMDFLSILGIIDSKQIDVFIYIAENTNQNNNVFLGTYSKISKDVGVSQPTIATIMKKLQENCFVKKIQNGAWLVNPNILMKGNDTKRQILLSYYQSDSPIEEISVSRVKQKQIATASLSEPIVQEQTKAIVPPPPVCDWCGADKVKRTNRTTGVEFWGCPNYQSHKNTEEEQHENRKR